MTNSHPEPGRPRLKTRPDRRITIRFRYHCDRDLIEVLDRALNASAFIRDALREHLTREGIITPSPH